MMFYAKYNSCHAAIADFSDTSQERNIFFMGSSPCHPFRAAQSLRAILAQPMYPRRQYLVKVTNNRVQLYANITKKKDK